MPWNSLNYLRELWTTNYHFNNMSSFRGIGTSRNLSDYLKPVGYGDPKERVGFAIVHRYTGIPFLAFHIPMTLITSTMTTDDDEDDGRYKTRHDKMTEAKLT